MNQKEKELRAVIHDKRRERYIGGNRNGFKSLLELEASLAQYLEFGHCDEIPIAPMARSSDYWVTILDENFGTWMRVIDDNPYNFIAYQVFALRELACDMTDAVKAIMNFFFVAAGDQGTPTDPVLKAFMLNMSFWAKVVRVDPEENDAVFFMKYFNSPIMIGEGVMDIGNEPVALFVNNESELNSLFIGVRKFLAAQEALV